MQTLRAVEIEYFLKKYSILTLEVMVESLQFHLNATRAQVRL